MQPPFRRFPKNTTQCQQAPRHFENTPSSDEKSSMVFTQPKSQQKIEHVSSSHNLPQCAPAVGTKDVPVGTTLTYSDQISGMSDQELVDETKWQTWKIEKEINKVSRRKKDIPKPFYILFTLRSRVRLLTCEMSPSSCSIIVSFDADSKFPRHDMYRQVQQTNERADSW